MTKKVKAIVIKSNDIKEKDKNVLLFSIEEGKIWATLKGVRGDKAKMKYAKEPFCFGDFVIEEGKGSNIITSVDIIETFDKLSKDIDKYFEASALLEIVNSLNVANEKYELFVSLIKALKSIAFENTSRYLPLLKFMLDVFSAYGVPLYTPKCACCGNEYHDHVFINYNVGELVCQACKSFQTEELSAAQLKVIKLLSENTYDALKTIKIPQETAFLTLKVLAANFYSRFEKNLKFIGIFN